MKNNPQNSLAIFETYKIRRIYDEKTETWFFSVIDIIGVLIEQKNFQLSRNYWKVLKNRLSKEGSQLVTNCNQLKLLAEDGKMRKTDVANVETILRLIQSIPSPKAEPVKLWLAKVGYERMQEMSDPEKALNRSRDYWQKQGRSKKWIQQRMMGQETRNKLTDYWSDHGVKHGEEFAILTNIIHQEWSDLSVQDHKSLKKLSTQNLRNHMSEEELIFTALAELSTRKIAETERAKGFEALWQTIEKWEGWVEGNAIEVYKISCAHNDKKDAISEYCVNTIGWVTKEECINLTKQGKIEAEICKSKLGNTYLRTSGYSSFQKDFDDIVEKNYEK